MLCLLLLLHLHKMSDVQEQHVCIMFCFRLDKSVTVTWEMLKELHDSHLIGRVCHLHTHRRQYKLVSLWSAWWLVFNMCIIVYHRFIPQEQTVKQHICTELFCNVYRKVFGEDGLRSGGLEIGFFIMTFSCSPCILQECMVIMELPGVHKSPGFRLYRQLNILWLCLEFVGHQCVHCFMSPIWHLDFWGGF